MTRLLLALCLCLAIAPAAFARSQDAPPAEDPACAAESFEEEGCPPGEDEEALGDDEAGACEPGQDEGEDGELDEEDGGDAAGDDEELAEEDYFGDEDELYDPQAEAEAAPPAPGFRDFCEAPVFDHAFLRRSWRIGGTASGFAGGVLTVEVGSLGRVPARFREQGERLVGLELAVVVGRRTKLSRARTARGAGRRGARRVTPRTLRSARRVKVEGKLLPPSRWRRDADGLRVPTLRAKRITVVR